MKEKKVIISWLEETFCESTSLFVLNYFYNNWDQSPLSRINPKYNIAIKDYLDAELSLPFEELLPKCNSLEQLRIIESTCCVNRSGRISERNQMFVIMNKRPNDFNCVLDYTNYIQKENVLLMDCNFWGRQYPCNQIIEFIRDIQPKI